VHSPVLVYYTVQETEILHFRHGARRPVSFLGSLFDPM
jgi:hypothetical protein